MYYYRKSSRNRVIHCQTCAHIRDVSVTNVGSFETLDEAYASGYRLCKYCSPLARQYRAESSALLSCCRNNAISCFLKDKYIGVVSLYSRWRIVLDNTGTSFLLYHRNTFHTKHDSESPIPNYHFQRVLKSTLLDYLEYIVDHEYYRMANPVQAPPRKKAPPMKGTKRYRKQQAKAKSFARQRTISNVLSLIARLSDTSQAPAAPVASSAGYRSI